LLEREGGEPIATSDIALKDHPLWIAFDVKGRDGSAIVMAERVKQFLISYPVLGVPEPQSCILLSSWTDEQGVLRAQTDCIAKSGFTYDNDSLADRIKYAFETGQDKIEYVLKAVPGVVTDPTSGSTEPMKLLATGLVTFL
jgi:hypothetical protein